jgi:hypothetical protein
MQAEGLKRGVPDICLPVSRRGFHGMYIELKVNDNQPTKEQKWYLAELAKQGYWTGAVWGAWNAIEKIQWYLGLDRIDEGTA